MADVSLRLAYGFNILVLAPVLFALYQHRGSGVIAAIGGGITNVDGLRLLVGALWSAVVVISIAGLLAPRVFVTLLAFQVVYKAIYLATYVAPSVAQGGWQAAPLGPTIVFGAIVLVYPPIIWKAWA